MILPIEYCSVPGWDPEGIKAPAILVVDDDPALRKALTVFLKLQFAVFSASSMEEAMQVLDDSGADAILLDYRMPGKDGLAGLPEIREKYGEVPVVLLTGYGDQALFDKARALGAASCLKKPIDLMDVLSTIIKVVEEKEAAAAAAADEAPENGNAFESAE